MSVFQKLSIRIKEDLNIDVDVSSLHRTYAGSRQKAAGMFLWEGNINGISTMRIGSCESATELLKAKKLVIVAQKFREIEICSN